MNISVNGEARDIADVATVADLLLALDLPKGRVAVEQNGELVRRPQHAETSVREGDRFEIVTLVGGG